MKTKLQLVIIICALFALIASPVIAADDISMYVSRVRLAYNGRSSTGTDRVVAIVHVRDANKAYVKGATVTATWILPDGSSQQVTAVTSIYGGYATFTVWAGKGTYEFVVNDVIKTGWLYNPALSLATTGSIIVR